MGAVEARMRNKPKTGKGIFNRMKSIAATARRTKQQIEEKQQKRRTEKHLSHEEKIRLKTQELSLKRKELKQKKEIKRLERDLAKIKEQENRETMDKARKAYNLVMYGSTKGRNRK